MKVVSARYLKSAMDLAHCPPERCPEIAFAGRSNVGKSSLLNTLLRRKKLAQTSKSPGKTRTLNFYDVNGSLYFVDLPGYGYAQVSKQLKAEWGKAITRYLRGRTALRLCVHLIDARHKPTALDHELLDLLEDAEVPTVIVATKFDKLKRGQRPRAIATIRNELELDADAVILPFSSVTGEGVHELWAIIAEQL